MPNGIFHSLSRLFVHLRTAVITRDIPVKGYVVMEKDTRVIGGRYMRIGQNVSVGDRTVLSAWEGIGTPLLEIGNNVSIGTDCHLTAARRIHIGDNVLLGKRITVTDNAHGQTFSQGYDRPPIERTLYSKGPVILEDNVWIGDNACILPNVHIGRNSIIGAGSVVTKDIPANSVAAGNPARIIKQMTQCPD